MLRYCVILTNIFQQEVDWSFFCGTCGILKLINLRLGVAYTFKSLLNMNQAIFEIGIAVNALSRLESGGSSQLPINVNDFGMYVGKLLDKFSEVISLTAVIPRQNGLMDDQFLSFIIFCGENYGHQQSLL